MPKSTSQLIEDLLREKASLKQDVFQKTNFIFDELKKVVREVADELRPKAAEIDKRLIVEFKDKGPFEVELRVAGDVLIFHMHTNVFEFDTSHQIWKSSYVKD